MPRNEFRTIDLPIADELVKRSGTRPRVRPQECAPYSVAGVTPKLVVSPRTLAEASKTIAGIAAEGASITIRAAATKQWRPPHPYDLDIVLDATRCTGIFEHTPADLTVTVSAGTKFASLQHELRARGQFFPSDPPFAADTTVGGLISSGVAGSLRQGYGTPRDNLLGMRVCLSDGSIAFTGAKVVKSVAGYDAHKLFAGAWGTLGFIGEVVLKVAPLPREECAIVASFHDVTSACRAALSLASSSLFPVAMTMHDLAAARRVRAIAPVAQPWTLIVRCAGTHSSVQEQATSVGASLTRDGALSTELLDTDRLRFAWSDVAELACGAIYPGSDYLCVKIACLPSKLPQAVALVQRLLPGTECTAHPANGILFAHLRVTDPTDIVTGAHELQQSTADDQTLAFLAAPPSLGHAVLQTLPRRSPVTLMRRIKATFDPTGTFDPGRFFAGI